MELANAGLSRWIGRGLRVAAALALAATTVVAGRPAAAAAPALTIKAMTFNTCANTAPPADPSAPYARCINGRQTDRVAADIARRITELHPDTRVVFLQEICYADVVRLREEVGSAWLFRFTGIKDEGSGAAPSGTIAPRACAADVDTRAGRGNFGIAVGVKAAAATFTVHYYPEAHVPHARDIWGHWNVHQAAICADVTAFQARVCGTHLTPTPSGSGDVFRAAQAAQVTDLRGYGGTGTRVILGGDLNSTPGGTVGPLYAAYTECDPAQRGTYQYADGGRGPKYDYIFATKGVPNSCYITDAHVKASDHVPVYDTVNFPAI